MFEDFINKKIKQYTQGVEFINDRTTLDKLRQFNLPPYIINHFKCHYANYGDRKVIIERSEFNSILRKALIFNINYVIKPKQTILKFLLGSLESRPSEYIFEKLKYFQFYKYYTEQIIEFINFNSLPFVSSNQLERLIDEINRRILLEIRDEFSTDKQRLNLIKLLFFFFKDLTINNPINIKLPKKILSAFFKDKGYNDIKTIVDNFFKDEIFIQEAVDLMKQKEDKEKEGEIKISEPEQENKNIEEFIQRIKARYLDTRRTKSEINKTIKYAGTLQEDSTVEKTDEVKIYSEELISKNIIIQDIDNFYKEEFEEKRDESQKQYKFERKREVEELDSNALLEFSERDFSITRNERTKSEILLDLFCEETYKKRIIKKIFKRNENKFRNFIFKLLDVKGWDLASEIIDEHFRRNKINYLSEEAVKLVDIMQDYFEK